MPKLEEMFIKSIKDIPDVPENSHIFERLASSADKEIRKAVSKKVNLSKKAVTILGFINKFTYYDETHN